MLLTNSDAPVQTGLMTRLRDATASEHAALEAQLHLIDPLPTRARIRTVLERFYGFHRVWEPAAGGLIADEAFFGPRRRLALLKDDLLSLGATAAQIEALPACPDAAPRPSAAAAMGSLYVMEGSTLGGQVIDRALMDASWLPPGGLRYFKPYGDQTGVRWRAFRARAEALPPDLHDAAADAAVRTFRALRGWTAEVAPA